VPLSIVDDDNEEEEEEELFWGVRTTNGSCKWIENHLSGSDVCSDAYEDSDDVEADAVEMETIAQEIRHKKLRERTVVGMC